MPLFLDEQLLTTSKKKLVQKKGEQHVLRKEQLGYLGYADSKNRSGALEAKGRTTI